MLDVVVIGGGPAGSRAAFRLAGMGYSVAVVEKREGAGQKPCCTGIISQECVNAFDIPPGVILKQTHSARVFSPSGESLLISRPQTRVCIVDRPAFDRALAEKAQSAGAGYSFGSAAENVSVLPEKVVTQVDIRGARKQLESRAVILATGFNAPLVKEMGLGRVGYFAAGAQTEAAVNGVDEVEIYLSQHLAPGFFGWLVPIAPGKGLIGLLTHHRPGLKLRELLSFLETQGKVFPENAQIKYGGIPLKPLRRTCGNRWLAVGDAAGQVKPTTGGGIYFGLICADIAANILHKALRNNDLSTGSLSGYERQWRKKLGRELRVEYFVRRFYERLNDKQINRLFDRVKSTGIASSLLRDNEVAFDWHGGLVLKALGLGVLAEIKRVTRLPF